MNVLVLARHDEDVSWVDLPDGWRCDIVQKDVDVVNMGREHSSFLWWIISHYDELPDTVCFSQAWPFDQVKDFVRRTVDCFTPMSYTSCIGRTETPPFDEFVMCEWPKLLGEPFPDRDINFPICAFLFPGESIRCRPLSLYEELFRYVTQTPEFHAHVLERLWPGIFS